MNQIKEIERLALKCKDTEYSLSQSIEEQNKAADKIRKLISYIDNEEEIFELLKNKNTSSWVAFQTLETPVKYSKNIFQKAVKVLKAISINDSPEAMAAEMRLKELNDKS